MKKQFAYAYVAGGFVSVKKDPHDIDVILETSDPYGPQSFAALSPFFSAGLETILSAYSIHLQFSIEGSPAGVTDYRMFFQYVPPKPQMELFPAHRGIVRINLLAPDIISQLHAALDPEVLKFVPENLPDDSPEPREPVVRDRLSPQSLEFWSNPCEDESDPKSALTPLPGSALLPGST